MTSPRDARVAAMRGAFAITGPALRSEFDWYESFPPTSEHVHDAVYGYIVAEPSAHVRVTADARTDVILSELDPEGPPRPIRSFVAPREAALGLWPASGPYAHWDAFVPRKPDNDRAFDADKRPRLWLAEHMAPQPILDLRQVKPQVIGDESLFRLQLPKDAVTRVIGGRVFVRNDTPIFVRSRGIVASIALDFHANNTFLVRAILGDNRVVRRVGVYNALTSAREYVLIDGEARSSFLLGPDLPRDHHLLRFQGPPGEVFWVHLPWHGSMAPHWTGGDIE
jgi:hypothetical protein